MDGLKWNNDLVDLCSNTIFAAVNPQGELESKNNVDLRGNVYFESLNGCWEVTHKKPLSITWTA